MSISCQFEYCIVLLVNSRTHVSSAVASTWPLPLLFTSILWAKL